MNETVRLGELMLDVQGLQLTARERALLAHRNVGGVILFDRNFHSPDQLQELIRQMHECNPRLLIAVDQEGGRVQRFRAGFTRLPALAHFGAWYAQDRTGALVAAREIGWLMAAELRACGVDFSFAPVLDLGLPISQVIGRRGFSADPRVVGELGLAFIAGMHAAGMAATGKHFPGHGSVAADSHFNLPVDDRPFATLIGNDIEAFKLCLGELDAVMPAHVLYPQVDNQPAGFSSRWLKEVLRGELGFDGVIFSDDLSMAAVHGAGSVEQRAQLALQAGCDMILVCNNPALAQDTLRWLQAEGYGGSTRLPRMLGKSSPSRASLLDSAQWRAAVATAERLVAEGAE